MLLIIIIVAAAATIDNVNGEEATFGLGAHTLKDDGKTMKLSNGSREATDEDLKKYTTTAGDGTFKGCNVILDGNHNYM
jgi:hypothetical protein